MEEETNKETKKIGRPSGYTEEIGNKICSLIIKGKSLKSIIETEEDMPNPDTVFTWLSKHKEFAENYARATEQRTESQLEELNELGEEAIKASEQYLESKGSNAVVQAYKLKADNMKWVMARMKPKKYGDKIDMTSDGKALTIELVSYGKTKDSIDSIDNKA